MSYLDKFGGTGEAYAKLPVYEAHKKIADGEITPDEASTLAIVGALECLNATMSEISPEQISIYEKYIIIKANSSKGLEASDMLMVSAFVEAISLGAKAEVLGKEGELGDFNRDVKEISDEILNEAEKISTVEQCREFDKTYKSLYEKRLTLLLHHGMLLKGHAEALEALEPQITALADEENAENITTFINIIKIYCNILKRCCNDCASIWDFVKQLQLKGMPEKKEDPHKATPKKEVNPDKAMLDQKKPDEVKKEVEENSYSTDKRKALTECLEQEYPEQDVDSFEKLIWLDDTGKAAGKRLPGLKSSYGKGNTGGWAEKSVSNLATRYEIAPKIPSRNILWDIIIILVSVALAALVAFHPAVSAFFAGATTPILAIITIIAFIIGANFGGVIAGAAVAFAWIVITYFLNKLVPFGTLLHIIVALALLVPVVFALVDISSRSKKAVQAAEAERRRYYENLSEKCENMQHYLTEITEKIRGLEAEGEAIEAAVKYYDKLKAKVSAIEEKIRRDI